MIVFPSRSTLRDTPIVALRVRLSPLDEPDAEEMWEAVDSSRASLQPWLPWVPWQESAESSHQFSDASAGDWDAGRALRLAIRARGTNQFLGVVGLENCVDMHRNAELGYWLRQDVTGRGLMVEAAAACLEYGFRELRLHRVKVAVATDNHRSLRVVARLGFQFEGIARQAEWCDGRWLDHATFSILEPEWKWRW